VNFFYDSGRDTHFDSELCWSHWR